jgi:hypothetical protein
MDAGGLDGPLAAGGIQAQGVGEHPGPTGHRRAVLGEPQPSVDQVGDAFQGCEHLGHTT